MFDETGGWGITRVIIGVMVVVVIRNRVGMGIRYHCAVHAPRSPGGWVLKLEILPDRA